MSSASPERWRRIELVLEAALQAHPADRAHILDRECDGDSELRREVESLLAAHDASDAFLVTSAESFAAPFMKAAVARETAEQVGLVIGRYRLIEEIGRGGMGTVWLAERADGQFEQKVALKLIKRGMDTDEILGRFLRERQILARLKHPNIARLLDGGVSEDGRPYFVMEQVVGRAITMYCDASRLGIEERLKLFAVVARAVGYAHRNLVVHRDIKPSNVLVGETGEIKLLDFGIAKLLGDDDDATGAATRTVGRIMTPEYASPEQREGGRITTASDVYQLGILLYELCTGQRPQAAPRRRLRGDLHTIALRALRDEPDRRYPSAEALAEDVERHLTHRPILFGGDRAWYRTSKFVRRHRVGVATSLAVIVLGFGVATIAVARVRSERDRARYEADKAAEVTQLMARFLQGWSPDAADRGEVSTRKMLGEAALRAERELTNRPDMLGASLSILGDFHTTVGEWRAADTLLARAQAIQQSLDGGRSADLAATLARRGRLYRYDGQLAEAVPVLERAIAMDRQLLGERHPETLRVRHELAKVLIASQKFGEAEPLLREILALIDSAGGPSPFALEVAADLGYSVFQLGRFDEAVAILRPALERQRTLFGDINASTLAMMRSLGSALRDRGDLEEAESLYRNALRVARALYGEEHPETEGAIFLLALVLQRKGDLEGAEPLMRQDVAMAERLYGADHPQVLARLTGLASVRLDRGDLAEAERLLRQVRAGMRRVEPRGGPDEGDVLNRLAYILVGRSAPDAERAYGEAVAFDDGRPAGQTDFVTDGLHFLAWAEHRKGDLAAAEIDYRRAIAVYERHLRVDHRYRVAAAQGLAAVLAARGKT